MKKAILIISSFVFLERTNAQDTTRIKADTAIVNYQDSLKEFEAELDSLLHPRKSYVKVEIGFINNNVYLGRKDSLATPYITPQLGYYHKSGLYANVLASYLVEPGHQRFDLFAIEAGYMHKFGDFEMQITGSKFFYDSNSYNVQSEIKETIAAAFSYDWKIITPVIDGTIVFGQTTDYAASFGLEHSFFAAKNNLEIILSAAANASTQNYYNAYYKFRKYKVLEKILAARGIEENINAAIADAKRFKLLDYELSLPITYSLKKVTFSIDPVYAIAINPASITFTAKLPNQTLTKKYKEKLSNTFFFQAGISYKF